MHHAGSTFYAATVLLRLAKNGKDTSPIEGDILLLAIDAHIPEDKQQTLIT